MKPYLYTHFLRFFFPHLFLLMALLACQPDEPQYPDFDLLRPLGNSNLDFGDTLLIEVDIPSGASFNAAVLSGSQSWALSREIRQLAANKRQARIYFKDPYMPSGNYDLRVQVTRDGLTSSRFSAIAYDGLELKRSGFVRLDADKLSLIDTNSQIVVSALNANMHYLALLSEDSLAFVAAPSQPLEIWSLAKGVLIYRQPAFQPSGFRLYEAIAASDRQVAVAQTNGEVLIYNARGSLANRIDLGDQWLARELDWADGRLLMVAQQRGAVNAELRVYNPNLVGLLWQSALQGSAFKLVSFSENRVGVWAKEGIWRFSLHQNNSNPQPKFNLGPNEELKKALVGPNAGMLYSTPSGLFKINANLSSAPQSLLNFAIDDVELDRSSGEIFVLHQALIKSLGASGSLVYQAPALPSTRSFKILYNK